ncbi:MAG TPA: hypothetical protein ENJ43_02890 [Gammaproteobacteria bacterium]|nr:hypothetical protein [Gammaproteobacteria bacterium]
MSLPTGVKGCALLVLLLTGAGCSSGGGKEIPDYFSARTVPPLKIPGGLTEPRTAGSVQLPQAAMESAPPASDVEQLLRPPRIIDTNDPS